jgi:hypothetical protein
VRDVRYAGLLEPALYGGVLLFNVGLTFWIGEPLLGAIAGFIYLPVTVLVAATFLDPRRQAQPADIAAHRYDFPYTPVSLQPDVRQIVAAG